MDLWPQAIGVKRPVPFPPPTRPIVLGTNNPKGHTPWSNNHCCLQLLPSCTLHCALCVSIIVPYGAEK